MAKWTRRKLLGAAALAAAGVGTRAFTAADDVTVTRHRLRMPGLPPPLVGLRIAHVTDVHLPGNLPAAQSALEHLARERPEVVVFTGDICQDARAAGLLTDFATAASGTLATAAVFGNYEYSHGLTQGHALRAYERAGVALLVNDALRVTRGGASLTLLGLDDLIWGAPDLPAAVARRERGDVELWLVHEPGWVDSFPEGVTPRPDLVLAGHTHGGQIRTPFGAPVTPRGSGRYVDGLYRDARAPLYVSRGVGTTLIRARLFCPAELPIFTLESYER